MGRIVRGLVVVLMIVGTVCDVVAEESGKIGKYRETILRNRVEGLRAVLGEAKGTICDDGPYMVWIDRADSLVRTIDYGDYYGGMTKVRVAWNWVYWSSSYVGVLDDISDAIRKADGVNASDVADSMLREYNGWFTRVDTIRTKGANTAESALFYELVSFAEYAKSGLKNIGLSKKMGEMAGVENYYRMDERFKAMGEEQYNGYLDALEVTPLFGMSSQVMHAVLGGEYMSNKIFAVAMGTKRRKASKKEWKHYGDITVSLALECDKLISPVIGYVYDMDGAEVMDGEEIYRRLAEASVWERKMEEALGEVMRKEREWGK